MPDITDSIGLEIKASTANVGSGIDKLINDLSALKSEMNVSADGVASLTKQFNNLGINLQNSKLKSTLAGATSSTLKYVDSNNRLVTVVQKLKKDTDSYTVSVKNLQKNMDDGQSIWDKFTSGISGSILKVQLFYSTLKRVSSTIMDITKSAADYEEALNLFTVTLGTQAEKATEWVDKFSSALYLDSTNVMQYMGSLNSLINGLGAGAEKSYIMSKNLTQLVYDLASFKNLSIEESFTKIQSAISGEIEPLRNVGVALSQNTLQELANSMGIEKRVAEMTEAEKVQLRYIQILKSTTEWQGDMGRTLTTPANAIRVLKEQLTLLGRAIGRVLVPFVMKAIPYVMALTDILTELANRLASFFGYEIADIDYSSLTDIQVDLEAIGDEADKTKNKLNTMLAPFDELNVVQNKSNSAGDNLGLSDSLSFDLPEYDALAGLTDQFSSEIYKVKASLEKVLDVAERLLPVFTSLWVFTKLVKFIKYVKDLKNVFSILKTPLGTTSNLFKTLVTRFSDGYRYSKLMGDTGLKSVLNGTKNLLSPFSQFLSILGGVITNFQTGFTDMRDYALGTQSLNDSLLDVIGTIGLVTAAVGLLTGGWGAVAVAVAGLIGSVAGYYKGVEELKTLNAIFDEQGIHIDTISNHFVNLFDESTKYADTVVNLSDKYDNAKLSMDASRDSLDMFIDSLALQDGVITTSQLDELKTKYDNLREETKLTHTASDDFYIGLIKSSGEATNATSDDIATQIANYKTLSSTIAGYEQEYIDKEEELTKARYTGKISVSDYNEQIKLLKIEYGYLASDVVNTTGVIGNFASKLGDIDYSSTDKLNASINKTKEAYTETIELLEKQKTKIQEQTSADIERYKNQRDNLILSGDTSETTLKKISELDKLISTISTTSENSILSIDESIKSVQGEYKGYLATIYGDLSAQGAGSVKEFSSSMDTIKKELKSLKDVDMSGTGKALYDSMESNILGSGDQSLIVNLREAMKKVGIDGSTTLMEYLTPTETFKRKTLEEYRTFGENITYGATGGIETGSKQFYEAIEEMAEESNRRFCEVEGINSPSTVYEGFGVNLMEGLIIGIDSYKTKVHNIMQAVSDDINNIMSEINFTLNTGDFENSLNTLLNKLQVFSNKFRSGVNDLLYSFKSSINSVRVGSDNKIIYQSMPYIKVPTFATGGYPQTGEFFLARESGPEMIGRIGNKTAVANNDQITTSLTNAMIYALSSMNLGNNNQPHTTVVNIGSRKVYEGMGDYVDSENDRYGTNYITV